MPTPEPAATDHGIYTSLASALAQPERVRVLVTDDHDLGPKLARLVNLEELHIHRSIIETVPAVVASLPKLRTLTLNDLLSLKSIPAAIMFMPSLRELTVSHSFSVSSEYRPWVEVIRDLARRDADPHTRRLHAALVTGDTTMAAGYDIADLVPALNSPVHKVRTAALTVLDGKLRPVALTLARGDEVAFAGKISAARDGLVARLARIGVTVARRGGPGTTLLVVGEKPGAAARLVADGIPVMLENRLHDYLNERAPRRLAVAARAGGPVAAARLAAMLAATDRDTVHAAVEIMRADGVPDELFPHLIRVVGTRAFQPVTSDLAYRVLVQYAPREMRSAVDAVLGTRWQFWWDKGLSEQLRDLTERAGGRFDPVPLAVSMLPDLGYGYLINTPGVPDEAALLALRSRLTGDALDLTNGDYTGLPAALAQLAGEVASLDLSRNRYRDLPDVLFGLTSLTSLSLTQNDLREIDDRIVRLRRLRHLDIRANRLDRFPQALTRLPELRSLLVGSGEQYGCPLELDAIGDITSLEELSINRRMPSLPDTMRHLTHLRRLALPYSEIPAGLPDWLAELPALRELDLSFATLPRATRADRIITRLRQRGVTVTHPGLRQR